MGEGCLLAHLWDLSKSAQERLDGTPLPSKHLGDQGACLLDSPPHSRLLGPLYRDNPIILQQPSGDKGVLSDIKFHTVPEIIEISF